MSQSIGKTSDGNNAVEEIVKIPLSKCVRYETDGYVRMFKVSKDIVERNGSKIWLNVDFDTNYQKDELRAKKFSIMAQSYTALGVEITITEEQLEKMLEYVRAEKKKVYCVEGSETESKN